MKKIKISKKFQLTKEDLKKWGHNALLFSAPALLVFLASVQKAIPQDASYGVVVLYVVNVLTDLLRKYLKENKYKK